jgi:hypothetical protein
MGNTPNESLAIGAVIGTFFPDRGQALDEADIGRFHVSLKWQNLTLVAQLAEVRGIMAGMPIGYMAELFGRAAAAREQLGLALTAVRDAEVWRDTAPEPGQENMRNLAGRALAESSGLWSVSAGHALVNVVARVVRAHRWSTHVDKKFGWDGPPEPNVTSRQSNLSLNPEIVKALRRAASETEETPLKSFVEPLVHLVKSPAWEALTLRRDIGYHRWRPQSIDGGALTRSPWVDEGRGTMSLSLGLSSGHVPPTVEDLVAESRDGHNALSSAMNEILARLPEALKSAGIDLWDVAE